jgi:hypothetical protein
VRAAFLLLTRYLVDLDDCARWLSLKPPPIADALHPKNLSWILEELNQCQRSHRHNVDDANKFLPSRLIHVGDDAQGILPHLVIVDYRLRRRAPEYVALSYCWGTPAESATQFKTEQNTLKDRMAGFELDAMTKVMQDAVVTTRKLSIRYLWIDAVCIIQDDNADWERESSTMGDVYRHAYVTICAMASPSCHIGFLERNPPSISVPFQSRVDPVTRGFYNIRLFGPSPLGQKPYDDGEFDDEDNTFEESVSEQKWARRGWTFQESMLSRRKLYFGSHQLVFSCSHHSTSETGADRLSNGLEHFPVYLGPRHDRWLELVEGFGSLDLTYNADRLPAISGMARLMGHGAADYYAGHWRQSLLPSLCWSRDGAVVSAEAVKERILASPGATHLYVAPSWSWATRKQAISFLTSPEDDVKSEVDSITCWTTPAGLDPFGRVKDGLLTVRGKLLPVGSPIIFDDSTKPGPGAMFDYRCVYSRGIRTAWVGLDWHVSRRPDDRDGTQLSLLLLLSYLWRLDGSKRRVRLGLGIILHPSSQVPGKYIRVGLFKTTEYGLALFRRSRYRSLEII